MKITNVKIKIKSKGKRVKLRRKNMMRNLEEERKGN